MSKSILASTLLVLSSLSLSSCQDEDYGFTTQNVRDGVYKRNFENMYGKISEDQIWDFSSYNLSRLGLEGGPNGDASGALTRASSADGECNGAIPGATMGVQSDLITVASSFYSVEQNTMDWLNEKLTEGVPHKDLGHPFQLVKPDNNKDFLIIPIYQGHSGLSCDLHLVASDNSGNIKDYEIWSKSQNLQYTRDYTKAGGEEFFYLSSLENQGGDIPNDSYNGGNIKKLKLGRAYSSLFEDVDNWTSFKVYITIPAQATFKCQFGNVYEASEGWTYTFDNSEGSAARTFEYDLTSILQSTDTKVWPKSKNSDGKETGMWNFGMKNIECSGCAISSYTSNRVHVAFQINGTGSGYTSPITITSTNFTEGHTVNRSGIMSKPIRIKCSNIKDVFYLYLDITHGDGDNGNKLANKGARQRSDQGMMLALTEEALSSGTKLINDKTALASALKDYLGETDTENWEYFVVGCEDANLSNTDNDINDVVFLVAGKKAPKIQEILSKRYMIEDLGSTFDFDFNDIVVDVTRISHKDVGTGSSTIMSTKAKLVHLCGTIPFQIKIGNTIMGTSVNGGKFPGCNTDNCGGEGSGYDPTGDSGYSALMNVDIDGWNPDNNNIIVTTWPTAAGAEWSDLGQTGYLSSHPSESFTFPATGKFPYIIACDQTVGWMNECYSIPDSWFKTEQQKPQGYIDYNPHSPGGNYTLTINMEDYNDITGFYVNGNKLTFSSDGKATTQVIENTPIKVKIEDNRGEWNARYSYGNGTNDFVERYQEKSIGTMPGYGMSYTFIQKYQVRAFIKNESLLGKNDEYRVAGSVTVNDANVRGDNCNYVEKGAQVTFKATANDGYRFLYWTSGNTTNKIGTDGDATLIINDNERTTTFVSAVFEKIPVSVTVACADDAFEFTINGAPGNTSQVTPGADVTVSAAVKSGSSASDYQVTWSGLSSVGSPSGTGSVTYKFKMPEEDVNLTAAIRYATTSVIKLYDASSDNNRKDDNSGGFLTIGTDKITNIYNEKYFALGEEVQVTASPKDGYQFMYWVTNDNVSNSYTMKRNNTKARSYEPQPVFIKNDNSGFTAINLNNNIEDGNWYTLDSHNGDFKTFLEDNSSMKVCILLVELASVSSSDVYFSFHVNDENYTWSSLGTLYNTKKPDNNRVISILLGESEINSIKNSKSGLIMQNHSGNVTISKIKFMKAK